MRFFRGIILAVSISAMAMAYADNATMIKSDTSIPASAWVIPGFTTDSVKRALESRPTQSLEGIWRDPQSGTEVAVMSGNVASSAGMSTATMLIVVLKTPMVGIRRGTVAGWLIPTARKDYYEAKMFTKLDNGRLLKPKSFFVHYTDGRLGLTREKKGFRINLVGLLPFMYRRALHQVDNTPKELAGYVRIWPFDPEHPTEVRYL